MTDDYAEYTVRVSTDGVKSPHDRLIRLAQHSRRARRYDGDQVEAEGEKDAVHHTRRIQAVLWSVTGFRATY
jgi:phage-related protein